MAKYQLRTFKDIVDAVCEQLKIQKTDIDSVRRIKRNVNQIYLDEVVPFKQWEWLRQTRTLQTEPYFNLGTASVEQNSVNVTLTQSPATSRKGYYFAATNGSQVYRIASHTAGSLNVILETPFNDATQLTAPFKIWTQGIALPSSCKEVVEVTANYLGRPLNQLPIHEFRRLDVAYGLSAGRPTAFTLGQFKDPERYSPIAGFPALVSRTSGGLTKKLTFASDVPSSVTAGSYIQVEGVGQFSYNGEFVVSSVVGPTLTYTGTIASVESATNDVGASISLQAETDLSSYRELLIHPAVYDKRSTLVVDMQMSPEALENDTDEPLMPVEDRIVLYYGAMWLSSSRERNDSMGQENYSLMQAKLSRMSGKTQASAEAPQMKMSSNYLFGKRRNGFGRGSSVYGGTDSGPFSALSGTGGASLVTGTPNTVAVFDDQGNLVGSDEIIPGSLPGLAIGYNNAGTDISATTMQGAITELDGDVIAAAAQAATAASAAGAAQSNLSAHINQPVAAHMASAIAVTPSGSITSTNVQSALSEVQSHIDLQAPLNSPHFTGVPTAPTPTNGTNTNQIATTAFVLANAGSPILTPNRAAISDGTGTLTSSIVTTGELAFLSGTSSAVQTQLNDKAPLASPALTGIPTTTLASPNSGNNQIASTEYVDTAILAIPAPTASQVPNTPAGNISATNVQGALNELDTEKADAAATTSALALKAPLASPALTGVPTAPTAAPGTSTTQLATTAFVTTADNLKANIASPTFTGVPAAPTAAPLTNTTQLATTAFVTAAVAAAPGGVTSVFTRTGAVTAASGDYTASQVTNVPAGGIVATTVQAALNGLDTVKAPLASPALTGTPTAPTATVGTSTTQLATTAFVTTADNLKANLASPALTGTPTAPTAALGTNTTQLATTAFVLANAPAPGLNWITPSDGALLTGYNVYNNGSVAVPTTGTGGTATVTFTSSTTNPLHGTSSYVFTKPAANVQGQGFSKDFTIDLGYYKTPTPETISMLFSVDSGTFATGDMTFWIYDTVNGTLIQPSAYIVQNSTGPQMLKMEFQPNSNSGSYRLIGHVASVSALAYTIKLDDLSVSPNTYNQGASVTDEVPAALVPNNFGTTTANTFYERRAGNRADYRGYFKTGTNAAATASISLPPGRVIDPTKLASTTNAQQVGYVTEIRTGAINNNNIWPVFYDGSDTSKVYIAYQSASDQFTKVNASALTAAGNGLTFQFSVPILGWGTSQVLSSDTDTRVVDYTSSPASSGALTADVTNIPLTTVKDSHGAWTGTTYLVPTAGDYIILGRAQAPNISGINAWVNGVNVKNVGTLNVANVASQICTILPNLKGGDVLSFRSDTSQTLASIRIDMTRISGPAQVAASEKVFLQYTNNAGTALAANTTNADFTVKVVDSHGAWNGTIFTAPRPSWYNITGMAALTTASTASFTMYVNGVMRIRLDASASSASHGLAGGTYLNGGDTMSVRSDTAVTLSNNGVVHHIEITSQG